MSAIAFDTLAYSKKLQESGIPREQAEAIAQANVVAFKSLVISQQLATKQDIEGVRQEIGELRQEMTNNIHNLDKKIDTISNNLDKKIDTISNNLDKKIDTISNNLDKKIDTISGNLERKLDAAKHEILKWFFGMLVALGAFLMAYISYLK